MTIKKQEFYEGAALHILARSGRITSLKYEPPLFILNDSIFALLKYSTKGRSPWGFTFVPDEQEMLVAKALDSRIVIGLVCGSDGVVAVWYDDYISIASPRVSSIYLSCYRDHGEHYQVNGPDGRLTRKVPPSNWQRILDRGMKNEAH
jgi:hypothetical protein